jgi:hypothetical protein
VGFDLKAFAVTPEELVDLQARARAQSSERKRGRKAEPEAFVLLPYERTLAAAGRLRDAPMAVLVELAHRAFKTHKNPVLLSNAALAVAGVSHDAKVRSLRRLEAAGLVVVDWRGGKKTPLVTLLWK